MQIVVPLSIIFGFLYIPAFIYGYFWLWVFPFTALVTLFLRTGLDYSIKPASKIDSDNKRAWAIRIRLFIVTVLLFVACVLPFIIALWLYNSGIVTVRYNVNITDQLLYNFVLYFFPDNRLPSDIDLTNGVVVIVLACSFFMIFSVLSFSVFGFTKAKQARLFIFYRNLSQSEKSNPMYVKGRYMAESLETYFSMFLLFTFLISVPDILKSSYKGDYLYLLLCILILFSVVTSVYTLTSPFVRLRR